MVVDTVILFESGLVLLVDHGQTKVGERQEQGRACADHHRRGAVGDGPPGDPPLRRPQFGMPHRRRAAEARLKTRQPLRGERDLRHQNQNLPAGRERGGDGLEETSVLPAPVTPSSKRPKTPARDRRVGRVAAASMVGRKRGRVSAGLGGAKAGGGGVVTSAKRAGGDQAFDHRRSDPRLQREFAGGRGGPSRSPPRPAGAPASGAGPAAAARRRARLSAAAAERRRHANRHPQHRPRWRQSIGGDPIDQRQHRFRQRRRSGIAGRPSSGGHRRHRRRRRPKPRR